MPDLYDPVLLDEIRAAIKTARWTSDSYSGHAAVYHGTGETWRFIVTSYNGGHYEASATNMPHADGHGVVIRLPPDLANEAYHHAVKHPFDPNHRS